MRNLSEPLLLYRHHDRHISARKAEEQEECKRRIWRRALALAEIAATDEELALHHQIASARFEPSLAFLTDAEAWLLRLRDDGGRAFGDPDAEGLRIELASRWARVCRRSRALGLEAWRRFRRSPLRYRVEPVRTAEVLLGALAGTLRRRHA